MHKRLTNGGAAPRPEEHTQQPSEQAIRNQLKDVSHPLVAPEYVVCERFRGMDDHIDEERSNENDPTGEQQPQDHPAARRGQLR